MQNGRRITYHVPKQITSHHKITYDHQWLNDHHAHCRGYYITNPQTLHYSPEILQSYHIICIKFDPPKKNRKIGNFHEFCALDHLTNQHPLVASSQPTSKVPRHFKPSTILAKRPCQAPRQSAILSAEFMRQTGEFLWVVFEESFECYVESHIARSGAIYVYLNLPSGCQISAQKRSVSGWVFGAQISNPTGGFRYM